MADAAKSSGIGFLGLLFIVLLVLKLTGIATIGWGWVFAPILIPLAIVLIVLIIIIIASK